MNTIWMSRLNRDYMAKSLKEYCTTLKFVEETTEEGREAYCVGVLHGMRVMCEFVHTKRVA